MIRPVISYALTSLILLTQAGLPVHMHYCKGILESVSVLFSSKCKEHELPANLPVCCKKAMTQQCDKKEGKKCCDDEVLVLKQNIISTAPSFVKWIDIPYTVDTYLFRIKTPEKLPLTVWTEGSSSDSGPPIFILHKALIFYA